MPRERYRYDKDLDKVVPILGDDAPRRSAGPMVMRDLDSAYKGGGFTSPIDGQFITSRSQLRAHNSKHKVRQAGDFKPGELIAAENKRVAASQPKPSDGVTFKWI